MKNPIAVYQDWVIEKSLELEMKGGNRNYLKAMLVLFGLGVFPLMGLIFAVFYLLTLLGAPKLA